MGPGRVTVTGRVAEDGSSSVDVPPGHYTLRAEAKKPEGWVHASVEASAGATDVAIAFPATAK